MKIGDRPEFHHAALNELMRDRANTPTMGGIIILAAVLAGTLLWARLDNPFIRKAFFIVIWYGGIGAVDDWLKLTSHTHQRSRDGLKPWEKLVFQFGGAVLSFIQTFAISRMPGVCGCRFISMAFPLRDGCLRFLPYSTFPRPVTRSI
jgi:phospho-N-acetylmuramoyl-pentapeptide-transferase